MDEEKNTSVLVKIEELSEMLDWAAENYDVFANMVAKDAMSLNDDGVIALVKLFSGISEQVKTIKRTKPHCPFLHDVKEGEPVCKMSSCRHCKYNPGCLVYHVIDMMLETAGYLASCISKMI